MLDLKASQMMTSNFYKRTPEQKQAKKDEKERKKEEARQQKEAEIKAKLQEEENKRKKEEQELAKKNKPEVSIEDKIKEATQSYKGKQFEMALSQYLAAMKLCEKDTKANSTQMLNIYSYIGSCYVQISFHQKAVDILKKGIAFGEENKALTDNTKFSLYSTLGQAYSEIKDNVNAMIIWKKSLDLKIDKENLKGFGQVLNNLGLIYFQQNDFKNALEYFEKSLGAYEQMIGKTDLNLCNRLFNLAETYRSNKQFDKSLLNQQRCLKIKLEKDPNNMKSIGATYSDIGVVYLCLKEFEKGYENFNLSIQAYQDGKAFGNNRQYKKIVFDKINSQIYANTLTYIGDCAMMMKEKKQFKDGTVAYDAYEQSYELKKLIFGPEHKKTMSCATNYGQLLFSKKNKEALSKATEVFGHLVNYQSKTYGEKSVYVAQTLNNLATVVSELHDFDNSIKHIDRAIELLKALEKEGKVKSENVKKVIANKETILRKKKKAS